MNVNKNIRQQIRRLLSEKRLNNLGSGKWTTIPLICYTYAHVDGNDIVYVGKGSGGRAWEIDGRQKEHAEWMINQIELNKRQSMVDIIDDNLSSQDAFNREFDLIQEYKPIFNINDKNDKE